MLNYAETPVFDINYPPAAEAGCQLLIKREDLNHPLVSGNKWWKLKYNLEEARCLGFQKVLTFGGPFSNHIYATAAAARECGLGSIGIIRGDEKRPLSDTLTFANSQGMVLDHVSRERYRLKDSEEVVRDLKKRFGDFYLIPEGGTNELAVKGCEELGRRLLHDIEFDCLCVPVGTAGTLAGLLRAMDGKKEVIGFSVLKGGAFLRQEVEKYIVRPSASWRLEERYHFGGYARANEVLLDFIRRFESEHDVPLDPVYTAKMVYGVCDLIHEGSFRQRTILLLHTGGLQGRTGFNLEPPSAAR